MILVVNALDLLGHDVGGLVPADADVAARAAVLRVTLAMRIPVDALHRIRDAVLGIYALFIAKRKRRNERFEAGLEGLAASLDLPRVQLFGRLMLVEVKRTDADDLILLLVDVDGACVGAQAEAVKAQAFDDGRAFYVAGHANLLSSIMMRNATNPPTKRLFLTGSLRNAGSLGHAGCAGDGRHGRHAGNGRHTRGGLGAAIGALASHRAHLCPAFGALHVSLVNTRRSEAHGRSFLFQDPLNTCAHRRSHAIWKTAFSEASAY